MDYEESMPVEDKLELIDRLSQELFEENRVFVPIYPWVFVMICKKEQQIGHIIAPENRQNKTVWEGIVLATWHSRTVERGYTHKNGARYLRCEVQKSEITPGERVVFPHWAGLPIPGYDVDRFRVVREVDLNKDGGIIYGRVDTFPVETKVVDDLIDMMEETFNPEWLDELGRALLRAKIEDRFVVVDRDTHSITLSGR